MMSADDDKFGELAWCAYLEFGDIGDFVWKAPRLIEHERKLEVEKLKAYFPFKGDPERDKEAYALRIVRWEHESHKLEKVFPHMMASGNLFAIVSVFEIYCLKLCKAIEPYKNLLLNEKPGSGISRYLKFLAAVPIDLEAVSFRQQVRAVLLIRNCLFHANGLLEWSRDSAELRKVVSRRGYWSEYTRNKTPISESNQVQIRTEEFGEQVHISNEYVHTATHYLKFHFVDLCKHSQVACLGECNIGLPTTPQYFD